MRTLLIPDVHQELFVVDAIIQTMDYDRILWFGDWFDSFNKATSEVDTAKYLRHRIENFPNDIFLFGNHDIHYGFNVPAYRCSGYTSISKLNINCILKREHWNAMKVWYKLGNFICSHAGFHRNFIHPINGFDEAYMLQQQKDAVQAALENREHWMFQAGKDRGGIHDIGGPLWMDWSSLEPIEGINQIVGHTCRDNFRRIVVPGSLNYCIDAGLRCFAIHDTEGDNELEIIHHKQCEDLVDIFKRRKWYTGRDPLKPTWM